MEPEAKYTLVGIVVLVVALALAVAAFWLSKSRGNGDSKIFVIYFKEHSLAGMQNNSNVTMKGINVGSVDGLQISRHDISQVKVRIKINKDTPVKEDTRAVITRNLLTGLANVDLINSTQQSPLLERVNEGEEFPTIPEGRSGLEALASSLPSVLENIDRAVQGVNGFLSDENKQHFTKSLANIEELTGNIAKGDEQFRDFMANLQELAKSMTGLSGSLNSKVSGFVDAVKKMAEVISIELSAMSQEIRRASRAVSGTVERYDDPKSIILGPGERSLGPGEELRRK